MKRPTLRRRIYLLLVQWFVIFILVAAVVTSFSFSRFRSDALDARMLLARTAAHYVDSAISASFRDMRHLLAELPSIDASLAARLRSFRFESPFGEATYVLDERYRTIASDPPSATPLPRKQIQDREAVTPLFYKSGIAARPSLAIIQPFQRGDRRYFLVSEMNPMGSTVSTFLQSLAAQRDLYVMVVDANGVVIAAPDQKQLFQVVADTETVGDRIRAHRPFVSENSRCTFCEESNVRRRHLTVMMPLQLAPWGVVVQQERRRAFATLDAAQYGFLGAGMVLVLMGVFLARALSKSVVAPIRALSQQAERLRRGDLSTPIVVRGDQETEVLATTMDEARKRLAATVGELRTLNDDLEGQVVSRTKVLKAQYENLRLLHDVSQVSTRRREPEHFVPEVLRLIAEHYSFPEVAMVTTPPGLPPASYVYPQRASLEWLTSDVEPPDGWERRDLIYQGASKAQLFYRRVEDGEPVMEALRYQLAMSLHGAYLLERTLAQDAQRKILVRRLMDAAEAERRRIARELHDEISQLLTLIQLSLDSVSPASAEVDKAKGLLGKTQEEVHRIMYDLRPSLLDDLGLSAALKWYATNYLVQQGLQVNLEIEEDVRVSPEIEIATFRIYQEVITNILRHARAENVSIELYVDGDRLVLGVEDDGAGFAARETIGGAGILGMRERAELVNGSITIDSEPGGGTNVMLEIPLKS